MIGMQANLFAVLEFSSLPMLGWLAAALLPWLIHRWHRQQHRTTAWAAVELLLNAMQQRARRVQMQQWLLLALRTAILVLVAVAVAEPALRQWAIGARQAARTHRIIVLDQSASMGCTRVNTTRWQRAKEAAIQTIDANQSDVFTLIAWSGRCENAFGRSMFDAALVASAVEELQLTDSCVEIQEVVYAITVAIERAEAEVPEVANHQVLLCTDLCPPTWELGERERALLEAIAERVSVTLVNVSEVANGNLAITDLQIEPSIVLRQQEVEIVATVASFGKLPVSDVSLELQLDGRPIGRQAIVMNQADEQTVQFTHRFVDEGRSTLSARLLNTSDDLLADDQRWLVTRTRPKLRVACFAGETGAVEDLVRALSPAPASGRTEGSIVPETYSVSRLGDVDLAKFDGVLLGSVGKLSQREVDSLHEYVRQGGGLGFFLGSASDRETLARLQSMLPVEVGDEQPVGEFRFDAQEYLHPIAAPFCGQTQAGLLGVAIMQYQELQIKRDRNSAEEVLRFDSGDPALVVDQFGAGRVAVFALPGSLASRTSAGTPWSTFPMSPSFLPVVRELVSHLVGTSTEYSNVLVDGVVSLPWQSRGKRLEVRAPDGTIQPLNNASSEDLDQAAIYEPNQQGVHQVLVDGQEVGRLAVNLDPRESNVQPVDPVDLPNALADQRVELGEQVASVDGDLSFTRTLLAAASALLLVEVGVACAMGRGWG